MTPEDQFLRTIAKTLARAANPDTAVEQFAGILKAEIKIKKETVA